MINAGSWKNLKGHIDYSGMTNDKEEWAGKER